MTLIEERALDEVAGANTQQEIIDFIERVLREMQRTLVTDADPTGF